MTDEELQQIQAIVQTTVSATVNAAVAPITARLDTLEQGQQTIERNLTAKIEQSEQRLTKKLNDLEYLAADYQDREIRKLMRRVVIIERQLQITPE